MLSHLDRLQTKKLLMRSLIDSLDMKKNVDNLITHIMNTGDHVCMLDCSRFS